MATDDTQKVVSDAVLDETHLSGIVANWGARVFYALCGLVVMIAGAAFGLGWYLADMQGEVRGMRGDVREVTILVRGQFEQRLRNVEMIVAPGILTEAASEIKELEARIRALERSPSRGLRGGSD